MLYVTAESLVEGAAAHVHVNEIIEGLKRRGWSTELVAPRYDTSGARPNILRRFYEIAAVNWRAARGLKNVDAIYCRTNPLLMPLTWLALRRGVAVVHEANGPYADVAIAHPWTRPIVGVFTAMQRWQFRKASGVVSVTPQLCEWLEGERRRSDVGLISNAANTDLFTPDVQAEDPAPQPFVAFFGALAQWHGVDMMLAAIAHPDWPQGVRLVVIGDGADSDKVRIAAARDPRIVHLGRQPYRRVPALIRNAVCGLVTIVDVGGRALTGLAPLKLFESLAMGQPVIVTDYPGQSDFVRENGCGIVVAPGDAAALALAVAAFVRDPEAAKAMGARGREAVLRDHSWDQRAGDVDTLLRRLISRN